MTLAAKGETDLKKLIGSMNATLHDDTFVFLTIPPGQPVPHDLEKQMIFHEAEGTTVIAKEKSVHSLPYTFRSRMVTLNIHSSLDAVGFLAVVASRLAADLKIGVNPVSGYFHDHLFVPVGREKEVLAVLQKMAVEAAGQG